MPNNNIRCEKCWRPAFQLPIGTVFVIFPKHMTKEQKEFIAKGEEKVALNLCIAHIKIFLEWARNNKIKLPKQIDTVQSTLMVNP